MDKRLIRLIVLDVDGTMTDGGVYIDDNKVESKKFSIKDGAGILLAQSVGIEVMILTARTSSCVEQRASELKIKHIYQGVKNKAQFLDQYMVNYHLKPDQIAYIGDDLNDLPAMGLVGFVACPHDACDEVKNIANLILDKKGGDGAVRAFIEVMLKGMGLWEKAISLTF